jgi:hypothetical protein
MVMNKLYLTVITAQNFDSRDIGLNENRPADC